MVNVDTKGLGIVGAVLAVLLAAWWWHASEKREAVENAGNAATVEAHDEREDFKRIVRDEVAKVAERSEARVAAVERTFKSYEKLQQEDWDHDLQTSDDFPARATRATERVFQRRERRLQEIFAGGIGMPGTTAALPAGHEAGALQAGGSP